LIPAVPVPLRADGGVDWPSQNRYVEYMTTRPVEGVAVWAHTGRGLHLTREVRRDVLASWRVGLGKDRILVAGVGARALATDDREYLAYAEEMARDAAEGGADLVMPHAPVRYRDFYRREEKIEAYHQAIADVGLPLILFYLYEAAGGIAYSMPFLSKLLALDCVVGLKVATLDSIVTFQDIAALVHDRAPEVTLVTGEDRFLPGSLAAGASAALVGMAAACPEFHREVMDAWFEGDYASFHRQAQRVDRFARFTFTDPMEGYILRMLHILLRLDVIRPEGCHDPFGPPLDDADLDRVDLMLKNLDLT